jgi:hypothetical protein
MARAEGPGEKYSTFLRANSAQRKFQIVVRVQIMVPPWAKLPTALETVHRTIIGGELLPHASQCPVTRALGQTIGPPFPVGEAAGREKCAALRAAALPQPMLRAQSREGTVAEDPFVLVCPCQTSA